MPTIIYYDFTSAESFVLHELTQSVPGAAVIEWRGVQLHPELATPMPMLDRWAVGRLEIEVGDAIKLAPGIGLTVPPARPNTRLAHVAVRAVERMHGARAAKFRDLLFKAFWWNGADLSNAQVLRQIADTAGVPRWVEIDHAEAQHDVSRWELDWQTAELGGVPRAIGPDGKILWGVKSVNAARAFFGTP